MAEYFGNICTCRKCNGIVHTIKRGDTLYLLSRYYNVTINEIMRANANVNVYNLQVGDQICIPVKRPMPTPSPKPPMPPIPPMPAIPGRPPIIQPRDEMNEMESETSAVVETSTVSNDVECCNDSNKKVKDFLYDEDMTLEEFAKLLKNL